MGRDVLLLYMSPKNANYKTQTNEGAVRYLIKEKETPDCILALCSETVRKKAMVEMPDGSTCTTLEYFRDALRRVGIPAERLVVIEVPDSMDDEKKQFQAISQLLDKIEKEDTLSIDLSGGMRDTAMLLVTAARCMRDLRDVQTRRVIYAELRGEEPVAHDRTQLYDLFDFVTAMDAFFSTGTAQKLKSYLWSEGEKDPVLHTLLTASYKKGQPNLNVLFQYNMPLRALAKMTGGGISMGMVDGIVLEAKGFWIIGLLKVIAEAVKNVILNAQMESRLRNS